MTPWTTPNLCCPSSCAQTLPESMLAGTDQSACTKVHQGLFKQFNGVDHCVSWLRPMLWPCLVQSRYSFKARICISRARSDMKSSQPVWTSETVTGSWRKPLHAWHGTVLTDPLGSHFPQEGRTWAEVRLISHHHPPTPGLTQYHWLAAGDQARTPQRQQEGQHRWFQAEGCRPEADMDATSTLYQLSNHFWAGGCTTWRRQQHLGAAGFLPNLMSTSNISRTERPWRAKGLTPPSPCSRSQWLCSQRLACLLSTDRTEFRAKRSASVGMSSLKTVQAGQRLHLPKASAAGFCWRQETTLIRRHRGISASSLYVYAVSENTVKLQKDSPVLNLTNMSRT